MDHESFGAFGRTRGWIIYGPIIRQIGILPQSFCRHARGFYIVGSVSHVPFAAFMFQCPISRHEGKLAYAVK